MLVSGRVKKTQHFAPSPWRVEWSQRHGVSSKIKSAIKVLLSDASWAAVHKFAKSGVILLMEELPAPPGMYKTPVNNGKNYLSTGAEFQPSTVVSRKFTQPSR